MVVIIFNIATLWFFLVNRSGSLPLESWFLQERPSSARMFIKEESRDLFSALDENENNTLNEECEETFERGVGGFA